MDNYSNSNKFNEFAMQEEFQHHQVTPPPKSEWWSTDIHESTEQDRENCKFARLLIA